MKVVQFRDLPNGAKFRLKGGSDNVYTKNGVIANIVSKGWTLGPVDPETPCVAVEQEVANRLPDEAE